MHICVSIRNPNGINCLDLGLLRTPEQVLGKLIDSSGLSSLGDSNRKRLGIDVQDIAAFNVPCTVMVVPNRSTRVVGVVLQNSLVEEHFAIALRPIHAIKQRAMAYGCQRIARKIRTRHWEEQGLVRSDGVAVHDGKRAATREVEIPEIQAPHCS